MKLSPREFLVVIASGAIAMLLVLVVGWLVIDRQPKTDGSFRLTTPGTFVEPSATSTTVTTDTTGETRDVLAVGGLVDGSDRPADLEIFRGGPLVINVWYSTCAPCAAELKSIADVHAELGDRVAFLGIDPIDNAATMNRFAAERGVTYDLWRDPQRRWVQSLGIATFPTTLFVDATGRVVARSGVVTADSLRRLIREHLGVAAR